MHNETMLGSTKLKTSLSPSSIPRRKRRRGASLPIKILAEKAITSSNYKIYILLFDMSKNFDTVNRNKLFEGLEELMLPEELHILHILTNDAKTIVRVGS